jgi:hypothetical protein
VPSGGCGKGYELPKLISAIKRTAYPTMHRHDIHFLLEFMFRDTHTDILGHVPSSGVSTVTRLGARRSGVQVPESAAYSCILQNVHTCCRLHPASYSMGTVVLLREYSGRSVKFTTHLHLEPRSRISAATPLLILYAFMACTRATTFTLCFPSSYKSTLHMYLQPAHYCLRHSDIQRFWKAESITACFGFGRTFISTTGSTKWTEAVRE